MGIIFGKENILKLTLARLIMDQKNHQNHLRKKTEKRSDQRSVKRT